MHALRHAADTRLDEETGDIALVATVPLDTARGYAKRNNAKVVKAVGRW